eukprot:COSAG02_NODE_140_length_34374_cov_913.416443_4_plen_42_part_00
MDAWAAAKSSARDFAIIINCARIPRDLNFRSHSANVHLAHA